VKLLVTGGCGFIGTNFIRYMLETRPDTVIVNLDKLTYAGNPENLADLADDSRYTFVQGDIGDRETVAGALSGHRIEAVVNFAAETHVDRSIADPAPFLTTNVMGTQTLLDCSREHKLARFLQVSTDEVYGSLGTEGRFTEFSPLKPNSPYAASKAAADHLVRAWHVTYHLPALITRCSNNYGPWQFPEKMIPLMYRKASRDEKLPVYGDGRHVRDWIHVRDHCRGLALALENGRIGHAYNFGGDAELRNIDVVRAILDLLGKPMSLIKFVRDRPGHDRRYAMDFSWATKDLGWEPEYDFPRGLAETLKWYAANEEWCAKIESGSSRAFMDSWYAGRK
jgi:dTDP-glucose 4,6-dehydratase